VAVVPAPVVVARPPAVYVPAAPCYTSYYYSPYVCPRRVYYGVPRVAIGIGF